MCLFSSKASESESESESDWATVTVLAVTWDDHDRSSPGTDRDRQYRWQSRCADFHSSLSLNPLSRAGASARIIVPVTVVTVTVRDHRQWRFAASSRCRSGRWGPGHGPPGGPGSLALGTPGSADLPVLAVTATHRHGTVAITVTRTDEWGPLTCNLNLKLTCISSPGLPNGPCRTVTASASAAAT